MRTLFLNISLLGLLVLSGCAHLRTEAPASAGAATREELLALKSAMESFIADDLNKKQHPKKIHSIAVEIPEQDGSGLVRIPYQLSYDTEAEDGGGVLHEFDAVAILSRINEKWKIVLIEEGHEVMKFDKPLLITAKRPGS
jgi:hypothetical protein